jgi:hypothetical protein
MLLQPSSESAHNAQQQHAQKCEHPSGNTYVQYMTRQSHAVQSITAVTPSTGLQTSLQVPSSSHLEWSSVAIMETQQLQ